MAQRRLSLEATAVLLRQGLQRLARRNVLAAGLSWLQQFADVLGHLKLSICDAANPEFTATTQVEPLKWLLVTTRQLRAGLDFQFDVIVLVTIIVAK